jgi:hypothetical protein
LLRTFNCLSAILAYIGKGKKKKIKEKREEKEGKRERKGRYFSLAIVIARQKKKLRM